MALVRIRVMVMVRFEVGIRVRFRVRFKVTRVRFTRVGWLGLLGLGLGVVLREPC